MADIRKSQKGNKEPPTALPQTSSADDVDNSEQNADIEEVKKVKSKKKN